MEFKKYKMEDIATFSQGKQVEIENQYTEQRENMKRFLRIIDFTNPNEPIRYVEDFGDRYYAKKDDLVMIRYGSQTCGKIVIGKEGIIANNMFKINLDNSIVINRYAYYYLKQDMVYNYLRGSQNSSTMPSINFGILNKLEIEVPNIDNQRKIVKILNDIDKKIKLNNEINNNLHELVNNILLNDLEQDNLEEFRLDELFYQITPGTNYQPERVESGIPFLNVKNINNGYIDFSDSKYISSDDYEKVHKTWQPEVNDLLISRIGTLGLVAVIREEDLPLAVHYNFLDFKTNKIPFEFCYFMFKSKYFQDKYRFNVKNSVQEYVTVDDIRKIEVEIPSNQCMEKYKIFYNKILNIQRENKALSQLRDTLLPKLMNGEINLDNIEI